MPIETLEDAENEALRRFEERAEEIRESLEQAFHEVLPGNHDPADMVMLAHLMTARDGYNEVGFASDWDRRPKVGWHTTFSFLVSVDRGLIVSFACEARYEDHSRQLAILIDRDQPGERLPVKRAMEQALAARGWRVMMFTPLEILASPEGCRERVEDVLFNMAEAVLVDAGVIPGNAHDHA